MAAEARKTASSETIATVVPEMHVQEQAGMVLSYPHPTGQGDRANGAAHPASAADPVTASLARA
jgi:hypothetical protein